MKKTVSTLALSAALLFCFQAAPGPDPKIPGYAIGDQAADFLLRNVDGQMVSFEKFKGENGAIIVFTCNHCPYAQLYEQRIIDLHRRFSPRGFPVIAINPNDPGIFPDDSFSEMQRRAQEMRYPFVYVFDSAQTVYPLFGARRTPHVFILDRNRIVRYIGAIDDNPETPSDVRKRYVENAIAALLRGERPDPDHTLAIGCPIRPAKKQKAPPPPKD